MEMTRAICGPPSRHSLWYDILVEKIAVKGMRLPCRPSSSGSSKGLVKVSGVYENNLVEEAPRSERGCRLNFFVSLLIID